MSLYDALYDALMTRDPTQKQQNVIALQQAWLSGKLMREDGADVQPVPDPGRPDKPKLVNRSQLKQRGMFTEAGRVSLAHALAHIEFNAINIGLDAAYRFRDMPDDYYLDWIQLAVEEAKHFFLLQDYLQARGVTYGDFPAHDDLWEMVRRTDDDVLVRMALVPRVMEARGLDVTLAMQDKLRQAGDDELVAILDVIYTEEIGHVAMGSRWFKYCCEQRKLPSRETFKGLIEDYMHGRIRGPYDEMGRMAAGFTPEEIDDLKLLEKEWFG